MTEKYRSTEVLVDSAFDMGKLNNFSVAEIIYSAAQDMSKDVLTSLTNMITSRPLHSSIIATGFILGIVFGDVALDSFDKAAELTGQGDNLIENAKLFYDLTTTNLPENRAALREITRIQAPSIISLIGFLISTLAYTDYKSNDKNLPSN